MISEKALKEYKTILKEECGLTPSDDEVMEEATHLLTMVDAIYRPVKKEWLNEYVDEKDKSGNKKRRA